MRFFLAPTAAAGLLLAMATGIFSEASAAACASTFSRVLVQNRFLDETNRAALLCRAAHQAVAAIPGTCRKRVAVPGWFSNSLLSVLSTAEGRNEATTTLKGDDGEVLVPITEAVGDHPEHQDRHVVGTSKGAVADAHVGVVYLEGDGDFVLTDTATGAEHRVSIEPGKLISWPNGGFTHRVEGASPCVRRRMLGPITFDAASKALVGVGSPNECTALAGYHCIAPASVNEAYSIQNGFQCSTYCENLSYLWSTYDSAATAGGKCTCFQYPCTLFTPESASQSLTYWGYDIPQAQCPPLVLADPISIGAASFKGRATIRRRSSYALQVTLTLPSAEAGGRRLQHHSQEMEEERDLALAAAPNKEPLNSADYALLVTVPGGGVANVTYKRTTVSPHMKPGSIKKPQVQSNGDLLWPRVPMPQYQSKDFTRTFKVRFRVSKTATSPLVFGASVWKGGVKLHDASPVTVAVKGK